MGLGVRGMTFSYLYLVVRTLLGALVRSRRGPNAKDIELLVLRHGLGILHREIARAKTRNGRPLRLTADRQLPPPRACSERGAGLEANLGSERRELFGFIEPAADPVNDLLAWWHTVWEQRLQQLVAIDATRAARLLRSRRGAAVALRVLAPASA